MQCTSLVLQQYSALESLSSQKDKYCEEKALKFLCCSKELKYFFLCIAKVRNVSAEIRNQNVFPNSFSDVLGTENTLTLYLWFRLTF